MCVTLNVNHDSKINSFPPLSPLSLFWHLGVLFLSKHEPYKKVSHHSRKKQGHIPSSIGYNAYIKAYNKPIYINSYKFHVIKNTLFISCTVDHIQVHIIYFPTLPPFQESASVCISSLSLSFFFPSFSPYRSYYINHYFLSFLSLFLKKKLFPLFPPPFFCII